MKISTSHKSGFTLVELLVVIAIIAVLALLGTQVGTKAIQQARKLESKTDLINICGAMEGFKADNNGVYPNINGGTLNLNTTSTDNVDSGLELTGGEGNAGDLVRALLGEDDTLNPRERKYFEAKQAQNERGGVDFGGTYSFTDYWGNAYQIIWDTDYNDKVAHPLDAGAPDIRRGVVAVGKGVLDEDVELTNRLSPQDQLKIVTSW